MARYRIFRILINMGGCLLFMALPVLFMRNMLPDDQGIDLARSANYWIFSLSFIALYYSNALVLIPGLLLKKKYGLYLLVALLLCAGFYFLRPFDRLVSEMPRQRPSLHQDGGIFPPPGAGQRPGPPEARYPADRDRAPRPKPVRQPPSARPGNHFDVTTLFIFVMVMALSASTRVTERWMDSETRAAQAEADRVTAELSFLKAQIHPHFLFNTLNNIYTLALTRSEHTAESILRLSNIMRYATDGAQGHLVPLKQEVECITDYIALQKLRLGEETDLHFSVTGSLEHAMVPPLLLMNFIENAFKYGISKKQPSPIVILLRTSATHIDFFCQNAIYAYRKQERKGIGLANTRQRLEGLYGKDYTLEIQADKGSFTVILNLKKNLYGD